MSNLSKREKILIFVLFIIIIAFAYYYLLYQPIKSEQKILKSKINNIETKYSSALTRVNKIEELEKELKNLKAERKERLEIVVREAEEVLAAVDFFARKSGVDILSYQKSKGDNGYPFSFNIEGEYFKILSFFKMLDNWDYRLVIENLSVKNTASENNSIEININMFYHQSDELKDFIEKAAG